MTKRPSSPLSKALSFLLFLFFTWGLLEGASALFVRKGWVEAPLPTFSPARVGTNFFHDIPEDFGVWHPPDSTYRHVKSCFDVVYRFNSQGMRDRERGRESSGSRVLVLGDSFLEGWGVEEGDRLSNRLEAATGREFLNFGTSGSFGPTQAYLLYEGLAKSFDHDEILVGVFPPNDFDDDNYELWKDEGRRRPFWMGEPPDFRLGFSEARPLPSWIRRLQALLREYSYFYNAAEENLNRHLWNWKFRHRPIVSRYYGFEEIEWERLLHSLGKLRESAKGKQMSVLLIPTRRDLQHYARSGKSPLALRLESWGRERGVRVFDSLPWYHEDPGEDGAYYFRCDAHWNARGNEVAFQKLREHFLAGATLPVASGPNSSP